MAPAIPRAYESAGMVKDYSIQKLVMNSNKKREF